MTIYAHASLEDQRKDLEGRYQSAFEFADELAIHRGGGRHGAAHLIRELFAQELAWEAGELSSPRTIAGGLGNPSRVPI